MEAAPTKVVVTSPLVKVISSNDPSLDSSILNSPSSVHRLQTSFRKKVSPAEQQQDLEPQPRRPQQQQQQQRPQQQRHQPQHQPQQQQRALSRASHVTNDSGQYSGDEQMEPNPNQGERANPEEADEGEHDRMLRPMRALPNSEPYRRPTVLDCLRQVALYLLPFVFGAVLVMWMLHFVEQHLFPDKGAVVSVGPEINFTLLSKDVGRKPRVFPLPFVFKMTVLALAVIGILLCPIVASAQSPYSFVFMPNGREQASASGVGHRQARAPLASIQRQPPPSTNDFDSNLSLLNKSLLTRKPKPLASAAKVKTTDSAKRKSLEEIETNVTIYKGGETIQLNTVGTSSSSSSSSSQGQGPRASTSKDIQETSIQPVKTSETNPEEVHLGIPL